MPRRTFRQASSLARKTSELSLAAPQVIAHRLARMARADTWSWSGDRDELFGIVAEKQVAFAQSWLAMLTEVASIYQRLALSALSATAWPWPPSNARLAAGARQAQKSAIAVAAKGLAPVHRKAVANAKRLARTRLR